MKKRIISLILVMAMALSMLTGCGGGTPSADVSSSAEDSAVTAIADAAEELFSSHSSESGKEETVFIIADANGKPQKTVVSAWLKNETGADTLLDSTTLTDLTNVKGKGSYTENGDGTITWEARGEDVYYQGTASQPLPVDVSIRYELDGKEVAPETLSGASGHLKITFEYQNNTGKEVKIDGETVTIYQPFTMISGTVLNNEKAANITVTNGAVINSGDLSVVVGAAMPGLKESLGLDREEEDGLSLDLTIPETVEVEADVRDFSLMTVLTAATNDALKKMGLDEVDSVEELKNSMNDLKDAAQKLVDGAGDLHDGVQELSDGTGDLDEGVSGLSDGAKQLDDGAGDLKKGTKALSNGANTLSDGLSTAFAGSQQLIAEGFDGKNGAVAGSAALAEGAKALNEAVSGAGGISLSDAQKQTIAASGAQGASAYASQFAAGVTGALASQIKVNEETMNALKEQAAKGAAQSVREQKVGQQAAENAMQNESVEKLVRSMIPALILTGYSPSQAKTVAEQSVKELLTAVADAAAEQVAASVGSSVAEQTATQVVSSIAGQIGSEETAAAVSGSLSDSLGELGAGIATQTAEGVVDQINAGMSETFQTLGSVTKQLADGSAALADGIKTLSEKTGELSAGLGQLNGGAEQLSDGAAALEEGAAQLKDGSAKLYEGTQKLDDGMTDLLDGVKQLLDGSLSLADGVNEFNEEGIEKLTELVLNDLDGSWQRLKAVQDYAEEYTTFSGVLPDMDCSVKFVYKTEGIG